jgi:surfactin synthase thioesterase subunit
MDTLITDMLKVIPAHLDKPYILFGHSLGSLVAFELMNQIKQLGYALPKHFIASGSKGPHKNSTKKPIYHLPHDEFIHELEKLNGTPKAILENKELLEFFVPLLKADFEIAHTYSYLDKAKFNCPITVLGGENDTIAPPSSLRSWGDFFTVPAKISILFGDHFFINSHKEMVIKKINKIIDNTLIALPQEKA